MTDLSGYSVEQFELDMIGLCAQFPTQRNPTNEDGCIYWDSATQRMCLVGMWLSELGLLQPADDGNGLPAEARLGSLKVTGAVAFAAACWQRAADCPEVQEGEHPLYASWVGTESRPRLPWAAVPALVADGDFRAYMGKLESSIHLAASEYASWTD